MKKKRNNIDLQQNFEIIKKEMVWESKNFSD